MIEPARMNDDLLSDISHARPADGVVLWWLGQSGFLAKHADRHLLLDPYLSDSLTHKYAATDKPHVRMTRIAVEPAKLSFVDAITSSHSHTDHLDAETIGPILQANPRVRLVIPEATRALVAERLGIDPALPVGLVDGASCTIGPFEVHGVPAAHETLDRDELGRPRYMGYVVRCGRWAIYHSGDTIPFEGMAELLRPFRVDVALLPINGRRPERRVSGNLWGSESAQLAHDIGARLVVPCHFEMFEFNSESSDQFVAACRALQQPYRLLRCGESVALPGNVT